MLKMSEDGSEAFKPSMDLLLSKWRGALADAPNPMARIGHIAARGEHSVIAKSEHRMVSRVLEMISVNVRSIVNQGEMRGRYHKAPPDEWFRESIETAVAKLSLSNGGDSVQELLSQSAKSTTLLLLIILARVLTFSKKVMDSQASPHESRSTKARSWA